jgi:hypothetical protein
VLQIAPQITHAYVYDNETSSVPIKVKIDVESLQPVTTAQLFYSVNWSSYTAVKMSSVTSPTQFVGYIPPQPEHTLIKCYFLIKTSIGSAVSPKTVPSETYEIRVGTDGLRPNITHVPLTDTLRTKNYTVTATVTDNTGVNSVFLYWASSVTAVFNKTSMANTSGDMYSGLIPGKPVGTTVYYYIESIDNAMTPNIARIPITSTYTYRVLPDMTPPVITHAQLPDTWRKIDYPIWCTAADNVEVDNVKLYWSTAGPTGTFNQTVLSTKPANQYYGVIPSQPYGTTIYYYLAADDNTNTTRLPAQLTYGTSTYFSFKSEIKRVLIMDWSQTGGYYSTYFTKAMDDNQLGYNYVNISADPLPNMEEMLSFKTIVGFTGNVYYQLFTSSAINNLEKYLDAGGKLFMTGQDIGYGFAVANDTAGVYFMEHYLHAKYIQDSTYMMYLTPVRKDDLVSKDVSVQFGWWPSTQSACNQYYPSEIDPLGQNVFPIYKYGGDIQQYDIPAGINPKPIDRSPSRLGIISSGTGGLRYTDGKSGVVYFSFGFEGIEHESVRSSVMKNVLSWLDSIELADSSCPVVNHTPLGRDIIRTTYTITAGIWDNFAVKSATVCWWVDGPGHSTATVAMSPMTWNNEQYKVYISTNITGASTVYYYITASDNKNNVTLSPSATGYNSFYVLPDTVAPIISYTPQLTTWRKNISFVVTVKDESEIVSVKISHKTSGSYATITMSSYTAGYNGTEYRIVIASQPDNTTIL